MNRQRRLLPHVLPAFRKLCRAFEKTFRRMKENVSAFKGKDFGLLMKTFRRFFKLLEALARRDEISFHYGLTGWLKDFGELLAEGLPASLRWISGAGVSRSADARHNMPGERPAGHRYNWRQNPSSRRCVFRYSWPEGSRYIRSSEPDR